MRIKDIDIYYFDIPLQQPFKIAIGTMPAANNVLIRIHTNEDIMGLGGPVRFLRSPGRLRKQTSPWPGTSGTCFSAGTLWPSNRS
jgi:L-alanine-DL-glutamate epimerase-like enolase superfamily enzyme